MSTTGLVLVGAAVGVLSGVLGIGGGIILVPALVLLFGLSQAEAQGTSLATIPLGAVTAAVMYHQAVPLRWPVVAAVSVGIVGGAYVGARLVPHLSEAALRTGFGGLCLYLGLLFLFDLRPTQPAGLLLTPVTFAAGWLTRRLRRKPASPVAPAEPHEYHI